jgi:hypothetical protein
MRGRGWLGPGQEPDRPPSQGLVCWPSCFVFFFIKKKKYFFCSLRLVEFLILFILFLNFYSITLVQPEVLCFVLVLDAWWRLLVF